MFHMVFSAEAEFETQPLVHYCINPSARPSAQCKRKICCCFFFVNFETRTVPYTITVYH